MRFKDWLMRLFGKKVQQSDEELSQNEEDTRRYMDISMENITAIIANSLSVLTFGDASFTLENQSDLLQEIMEKEFAKAKVNIACGLGVGMIASIPYCVDNGLGRKVYVDTVTKDRFFITGMQGDDVTQCAVISDVFTEGNSTYIRWTEYEINNGNYIIRNKCMRDGQEILLGLVDRWADIQPEIVIRGVEKLPIGIFKCPSSNRRPDSEMGLPITFGCDSTLAKINKTLKDVEIEFDRKKVKVFADKGLLRPIYDEQGNIVRQDFDESVFVKFSSSDSFTTEVFDPAFRETGYFTKLQKHFEMLEKEVGISKGILTELETNGATATEIKRSTYATFCLVDDIRKNYENYINDLLYGVQILLDVYGLERFVENQVDVSWSYAMLEDSQETFSQITEGVSLGAESVAELRQFLHPEETLEESEQKVQEIEATQQEHDLIDDLDRMEGGLDNNQDIDDNKDEA